MIGDVIGKPGRVAIEQTLPAPARRARHRFRHRQRREPRRRHGPHVVHRRGLFDAGVDVITSGNHIWDKREIYPELDPTSASCGRSTTARTGVPGRGWGIFHALDGTEVAVINAQGRTYMEPIENPFTMLDRCSTRAREAAEGAPGRFPLRAHEREERLRPLPRRAGERRRGTHTHVATADERILPRGHGVSERHRHDRARWTRSSGSTRRPSCRASSTRLPTRFEVGTGPVVFNAAQIDIDPATGRAPRDRADPAVDRRLRRSPSDPR